jgi:PAS domain S-box-containing protein
MDRREPSGPPIVGVNSCIHAPLKCPDAAPWFSRGGKCSTERPDRVVGCHDSPIVRSMRPSVTLRWLVVEIIAIIALTQAGVRFLLPALIPDLTLILGGSFPVMAGWAIAVGLILWRVCWAMGSACPRAIERGSTRGGTWKVLTHATVVFVAGLGCTGIAVMGQMDQVDRQARIRFSHASDQIVSRINLRLNAVTSALRNVQGLYAASQQINRREFSSYVAGIDVAATLPGVAGLGVIQRVPRTQLDAFVAAERADEAPEFLVKAPDAATDAAGGRMEHPDLFVVKYIEPLDGNRGAWGFDIGSQAARRVTAEQAVATGLPTLSDRVQLMHFGGKHTGYLLMLAIYQGSAMPATIQERTDALCGIAYAPIMIEHAMDGVGGADAASIDYEVFEGETPSRTAILYDRDGSLQTAPSTQNARGADDRVYAAHARLTFGGRVLTVVTSAGPAFTADVDRRGPITLGLGGLVTTLLLTGIVWSLGSSRVRALALARGATDDLKAANASAERLAEIARRTSNRVIIVDPLGRIDWVNDGFTRNSGYTLAEVAGLRPEEFLFGPLTDPAAVAVLRDAAQRRERASVEVYHYAKDGRACLIASELTPLRDAAGELTGFMSVESDITARRQVELALAASERRMRTIFEAEPEGVMVVAMDGQILEMNAAGLAMMEAACIDELRACGLAGLVSPEHEVAFGGLLDAAARGEAAQGAFESLGLKGTRRWLDAHAVPLRGDDASVTGMVAVIRDITAGKRTQVRDLANLELSSRLVAADDVREVADAVLDRLAAADLGVARAAVLVYADDGICRFVGTRGLSASYCREVEGHCPWKRGVMDACAVVVDSAQTDPTLESYRELFAHERIGSLAFIPLTTDQGVVGKIMLYADQPRGLCAAQVEGCGSVSVVAGMSVARIIAAMKLERSEERTRLVIDTALDAVVALDEHGVVTQWNAQAQRTFGWAACEAIGMPLGDLILARECRDEHSKRLEHLRTPRAGAPDAQRVEVPAVRKDGANITVELAITPVRATGKAADRLWFSAFLRDITERKRIEARVAESEGRFRALSESAPMMVWTATQEGGCDYVSRSWTDFTGRDASAELGEGWMDRIHPEDLTRCRECFRLALERREPFELEYRLHRHDGCYRAILSRGVPRNAADGTLAGFVGACIDISELREARARAEMASQTKSEFLANMSHEIRTPLTAIMGFADLLREDGNLAVAPEQRIQTIDTIRSAGTHLLTVINDILDLSKIEADKMTVERIETPLVCVLREVESLMMPRARGKGVSLCTQLRTGVPDRIMSDPTRLRQILMNLAGNAVKFTEEGRVTIAAAIEHRLGASWLIIDVEDTGPGMTSEQVACLFQAFGQADQTMTRKHGGTGLGLTICRRLAGLMGGTVTLTRTGPGEGSCFRVELPVEPVAGAKQVHRIEDAEAVEAPELLPADIRLSGRILLAEDGIDNQRLIGFHLRKAGATLEVAGNGRIALELIEQSILAGTPFDLLLSDMQMPEMDGYTLARTLRDRGSALPIVALTAHAMADDRAKCVGAGCDDYVSKPIDKGQLLRTCNQWLCKHSGTGPASRAAA